MMKSVLKRSRALVEGLTAKVPVARHAVEVLGRVVETCRKSMGVSKPYSGSAFDRLTGLEYVLEKCRGKTVLDVGSCDGLVGYEFARNGARLVHGIDVDRAGINFSRRLFRYVPVASLFARVDVSRSENLPIGDKAKGFLCKYDIVLFLGMYHHLRRQADKKDLERIVTRLLQAAETYFVVRTDLMPEVDDIVTGNGFGLVHGVDGGREIGKLNVYKRRVERVALLGEVS